MTGSAFASNIQAAPAEVKWLSGAEYVKRFDYPRDRLFTKVFCSECRSGLPFLNKSGKKLFIPAGSLDSAPGILPGHKSSGAIAPPGMKREFPHQEARDSWNEHPSQITLRTGRRRLNSLVGLPLIAKARRTRNKKVKKFG